MVGGFFLKNAKNLFFAVQIEKTEKNNFQKNGEKSFFTFYEKEKRTICETLETSYGALTAVIKIHRQLSHVMRIAV